MKLKEKEPQTITRYIEIESPSHCEISLRDALEHMGEVMDKICEIGHAEGKIETTGEIDL